MRDRARTDGHTPRSRLTSRFTAGLTSRRRIALVAGAALAVASVVPLVGSESATAQSTARVTRGDVLANLFEWNWPSVAKECTDVLGPAGYGGVQVAPPQDSVKRTELGNGQDTILHPWWEVYQPVDYKLTSRMGNEKQFRSMVSTCRRAGVKVYVDAVINHMTGQGHVSYGGVEYTHFNYPNLYSTDDFHHKGAQCDSDDGGIDDYNNVRQVFNCELVGLADLDTSKPAVQAKLAGYLNKLIGYGVSGFRVDAAKHIGQADLTSIEARLHRTEDGTKPYIALEVFGGGPGVLSPFAFLGQGSLLGLDADKQLQEAFNSYPDAHVGSIATLRTFGVGSGLTPSRKSLVFVQNHDTERNGDALNYKTAPDGKRNILANEFILGYGYGRPQVYSSFAWNITDDSPPSTADGMITDTDCSGTQWICVDRNQGVLGMVGWHNQVGDARVTHWWDDGQNVIAFSRGHRGWLAMNNDKTGSTTRTFQTGLAAGTYCDVIHGSVKKGACTGPTVKVNSAGRATVTVNALDAVAFSRADLVA